MRCLPVSSSWAIPTKWPGRGLYRSREALLQPSCCKGAFAVALSKTWHSAKLTFLWQSDAMPRSFAFPLLAILSLGLAGCDSPGDGRASDAVSNAPDTATDPVMARAFNDPLMTDPDLALRSEANAVVTFADSAALPVIGATSDAARRAREAARRALLAGGTIPDLPAPQPAAGGKAVGGITDLSARLAALNVPAACVAAARRGFDWAARLVPPAGIIPQGMTEQAAGSDLPGCGLRVVRYLTAAAPEDALTYHYTLAMRSGLAAERFAAPEAMLVARSDKGERLHVHARGASAGMTEVDMVFWVNP